MATTLSAPARRKPKGDKRDRTRAALLEAARALIREKGYERTTLDEVAQRAGMTTGAIYGNFKNRDELFIALGQTYWAPVKPRLTPGATFAEAMRALAEATLEAIPERPGDSCPDRGTRPATDSDPGALPGRRVLRRVRGVGQSPPRSPSLLTLGAMQKGLRRFN